MNYTNRLMAQGAWAALLLLFVSAFTLTAQGQQSGVTPAQAERERRLRDDLIREQIDQEREMMMLMTEKLRESASTPRREPRMAMAQIREDYVRLQVINNELAEAVAASPNLDFKLVSHSTAEIRKRADRLMYNLALPEQEGAPRKTPVGETEQLKPALAALDLLILRLVRNPLFRNPKLIDAKESPQVRRDLEQIIELSGQLKRRSEQLSKAVQKTQ